MCLFPRIISVAQNKFMVVNTSRKLLYKGTTFSKHSSNMSNDSNPNEPEWLGVSVSDLYGERGPWNYNVQPVSASKYHAVLYQLPLQRNTLPKPHYNKDIVWDEDHVRMPHSEQNLFPVKGENNEEILKSRWEIIQTSLLRPIKNSYELENAISEYNSRLPKFLALHYFFEEVLEEEECNHFFGSFLPEIINLALQLPELVPCNIPLLKHGSSKSVSLSQLQVSCLLANAFLCTFPWRKESAASYPGVNFVRLYIAHSNPKRRNAVSEKLKCICHYFRRVLSNAPMGVITFERKHLYKSDMPRWDTMEVKLSKTKLHVTSKGTIEDDGLGMLQVDFANKYVGGGVLGSGCVQEEIRYVICPELILARLFVEQLGPNEALVCIGAERYSNYSGYGDTFAWDGNHQDETPYDSSRRKMTSIVAIDASKFSRTSDQYNASAILRELNKAYVGFHSRNAAHLSPVATGNWGCGAFRGNSRLKSLIQIMACAVADRDMAYFTFGDNDLRNDLYEIYSFLAGSSLTVCHLWQYLLKFSKAQVPPDYLYQFIKQAHLDSKNQPTIQSIITLNKKPNNIPSSSSHTNSATPQASPKVSTNKKMDVSQSLEDNIEIEEFDSDIDMAEQEKVPSKKVKVLSEKDVLQKLPKNHDTIMQMLSALDGEIEEPKCSETTETSMSLLSAVEEYSKQSKAMDVEEDKFCAESATVITIEENVTKSPSSKNVNVPVAKARKITDYFTKVDKHK